MKLAYPITLVALIIQISGCAAPQTFRNENAGYKIYWNGNNVARIDCKSNLFPDGFIIIRISRWDGQREVVINDKHQKAWATTVFKKRAISGGSSDIVFSEETDHFGSDRRRTREWKLENESILIYKEILILGEDGRLKKQEYYGPFGVLLKQ